MKIRSFLPLLTYPDAHSEASIRNAAALAGLVSAELHVVALEADVPPVTSALSRVLMNLPELIRNAETLSAQAGAKLMDLARGKAEASGLPVTARTLKAAPALLGEAAASEARYFDLALVGWSSGIPGIQMLAEAMVFGSGRPTILVPEGAEANGINRIAIAWDGSRVAARALADATRLLERAREVHVVTVTDEKPLQDEDAGARLAEGLRQAGVKASFLPIRAEDCPIAETLQRHALELDAQLLIMGGYGHSRLRDFVLGGATAGVLRDLRMPVLLSH
ncbi:universal stress protein [Aquamicrobium ahrensii]|uniref:Nucleotide-binding universal stress UspA family protein n=1 Tax=Aquamicrobium ahrensii TaxID=469551 RepID=A0ABV2KRW4_9HYPH